MADKAEMAEAKPDAKESIKDAKKDNDSKNEETKNGEKEEDDESSDEEEHEGLYDKPVVIEGKRERKTTVFLASQTPQTVSVPKPLLFKGKGESLGSMERTNHEIGRSTAVELKPLHKLLFGRDGRAPEIKKNIRKFNGFAFEKDSKEYEAKKFNVERFTNDGLKRLCEIFDLEKKGKRSDLQEKVMDFLMSPKSSGRPAPQPKAKKSEEKKRKRSKKDTPKSKTSSTSKKGSETVESGDDDDEEDEDEEMDEEEEEEEEEEDEQEEPPKKKKKAESTPKKTESSPKKTKSTPKKTETTPKKGKETKAVKEKAKDKDKGKSKEKPKAKKTDEKTKASKKKEPVPVKITPLKKPSPKKPAKKEKPAPVEDDSSDEEPLAKKTKKDAPSNSDLEKIVKGLLEGADLEKVTMKSVCKQVYDMFPDHDLTSRKDFIKETVRKVIS